MKIKDIIDLFNYGVNYEFIGAMTGKKLFDSSNKKETQEKYYDLDISDNGILRYKLQMGRDSDFVRPIISCWVVGK